MTNPYNKEWWDKLDKLQQLSVTSTSIRGAIINSFIYLESVMADVAITVDFNSDYTEYYKGFRSTKRIIDDFFTAYDKIPDLAEKYFVNKESLKTDIEYLADIRNRAAHFLLVNSEDFLKHSDPFQDIYFYSMRKSKNIICTLRGSLVRDYDRKLLEFVHRLGLLQQDVYKRTNRFPADVNFDEQLKTVEHIELKKDFPSLKPLK